MNEKVKFFCERCGRDMDTLTTAMLKAELPNGSFTYSDPGAPCRLHTKNLIDAGVIMSRHDLSWLPLVRLERAPSPDPCPSCAKELEEWAVLVAAGGVYFKCATCSVNGVVLAGSHLAKSVRKETRIKPPKPIGMMFHSCEQHAVALAENEQPDVAT